MTTASVYFGGVNNRNAKAKRNINKTTTIGVYTFGALPKTCCLTEDPATHLTLCIISLTREIRTSRFGPAASTGGEAAVSTGGGPAGGLVGQAGGPAGPTVPE